MEDKWLELWLKNYNNESAIAKNIMALSKQTYKGDTYLPWSLMVGALYQLDPNANVKKVNNSYGSGFVFTDEVELRTHNEKGEFLQTVLSHMVKVQVTFMGKVFEDTYPIQENDYSASKIYDQNKVNKAQQRCLARVISMATGIGWRLYEQTEAQFEDDKKGGFPVIITVSEPVKVEDASVGVMETQSVNPPAIELATLILENKDNDKIKLMISNYNTVLSKQYNFIIEETDTMDTLADKFSKIKNPDKMLNGIKKVLS